ncbi:hypothetical protein K2173_023621 [Erythroxylum novogranatense]|uniref:RING-type E3 ubiquitin transferase n=1 Tax=Erythroxylum novogranatense TaxID=1862640 RepID=A0AAV8TP62_9ROSI|nr:hypothetical protein K2173_023621 [Erythroxylum novogranatense]
MEPSFATTTTHILQHTTAFLSQAISQSDFRHQLLSILRSKLTQSMQTSTLKPLNLAFETVETSISTTNPSVQFSSLRLAEKLLLSCPKSSFSSFLLSLIYALTYQHINAALSVLNIFQLDPSLARSEIAPVLFEELFLSHLLPVLQWFNEKRTKILSSFSMNMDYEGDDNSICDVSVAVPSSKLLSNICGVQALELKELENAYGKVLDKNCRVFASYFKEVLETSDENISIKPPPVIVEEIGEAEDNIKTDGVGLKNVRYNPIWREEENSLELYSNGVCTSATLSYPQRVSLEDLRSQSSRRLTVSPGSESESEAESSLDDNLVDCSSLESEVEENNRQRTSFEPSESRARKHKQLTVADSISSSDHPMADADNSPGGGKHTPPKDFVCPITSHLFDDPVTLETGQTYERRAIQEWLDRGNSTCPITRQKLQSTQLPKTNYVLKRLIASWKEQHPISASNQLGSPRQKADASFKSSGTPPTASPNSVISKTTIDGTISELRQAINNLCMSEILHESEVAVLRIERFWKETNMEFDIQSLLSRPPVVNGFVEILFNSVDPKVLKATVLLLSELGSRDKGVIQTLTRVDSDVECIVALFKNGLLEAVVLIYLLTPTTMSLLEMDLVESLLTVIKKEDKDMLNMCVKPKTAAVLLLDQILGGSEESTVSSIANAIISTKVIEKVVRSLEAQWAEERIAAVGILLRCIQEDGKCRNTIADQAELAPVLESFCTASDSEQFEIVHFLSELVKLNRRTFNEQVLHIIKDEGSYSTMHTLLNFLQTAPQEQCPVVAGLLLQLDLLAEPRKMSIYREETIDTLISCLRENEFPAVQIAAAKTIVSLQGRFTASGKSLTRAMLLKRAGLDKSYKNLIKMEQVGSFSEEVEGTLQEEERAAEDWERKVGFALVTHEFGLLFEALSEGLKSRYAELCSACFVSATWLAHMLNVLPDTGIRGAARVCLLKRFVAIFKSAKDIEDKVLSLLVLKSFIDDADGLRDITFYMKDIKKGLRELRKSSRLAFEIMKILSEGQDSSADLWSHKELALVDCSENGEVLSIASFNDKIFSGHSDGTIKVWAARSSILQLIQVIREHTKAVTSLTILQSSERLYSGSADKTSRVWSFSGETLRCVQVHDMKDPVHNLVVANSMSCFIPQGAGVKVHSWNGGSKLVNQGKYVKCLCLVQGKLYCGCHDSSIQEIDLATGTVAIIQSGSRKLLGKANSVNALQIRDGQIHSASSSVDGSVVKIWSCENFDLVGTLSTTSEVRTMAISADLIYLGSKGGIVEIWDRKKQTKIEVLQTATNAKVLCMALDPTEEVLVIGTSDSRIQAWELS